jgi:hypothetical protein
MENKIMKNFFTSILLTAGLCSCAAGTDVSFADRFDMQEESFGASIDEVRYTDFRAPKNIKTLGSVTINKFDKVTGEADPSVIMLKKYRSKFYAETKLFESDNKEKSFFDESSFNFGIDKKSKGMSVELSLKF